MPHSSLRTPRRTTRRLGPLATLLLCLAAHLGAQDAAPVHGHDAPAPPRLQDDLGSHHREIGTRVPLAQRWFDQGLRLYYAFNHAEAIRAFDEAARLDPTCAICHWGASLSYGPNINLPMDSASGIAAWAALERARSLAGHARPVERALITALATRYAPTPPADRAALDSAYVRAMMDVVRRFPADHDARTLLAEARMDLRPWAYWRGDGTPQPGTRALLADLEHVMRAAPAHPGANHFYIHAIEAAQPARALAAAERLAGLMPGAGHLVHMPSHIYVRVGRWRDAIAMNEHAVHADERYIADHRPAAGMYTLGYYPHNHDFLAFAASMIGRRAQALDAAERLRGVPEPAMLRLPGMTFLQHHATRHLQLRVRFADWGAILAAPAPAADLPHARAMWHYARGRALVAQGDLTGAAAALDSVRARARDPGIAHERLEFNTSGDVLGVAAAVLAAHLAAAQRDTAGAIAQLRDAIRREDALNYGEPPEWTIPVRQEAGQLLLALGRTREAARAFREDLARFPDNGWSLAGLARALRAAGRTAEAADAERRFARVWEGDTRPTR